MQHKARNTLFKSKQESEKKLFHFVIAATSSTDLIDDDVKQAGKQDCIFCRVLENCYIAFCIRTPLS